MPHHSLRIAAGVAALLAAQAANAAGGEPSLFQQRPTTVYGQLGLGTPLGWGGGELEQTVTSFLALSGGVGLGFVGPQVAFMPRLRYVNDATAATAGLGISYGQYRRHSFCFGDCSSADFEGKMTWVNLEAAIEHRWPRGLALRLFFGLGRRVAGTLSCTSGALCGQLREDVPLLPYLGVALGWSF